MPHARTPHRPPYWTLAALLLVISVPLSWNIALLVAVVGVRTTVQAVIAAKRRRTAGTAAAGDVVRLGSDPVGRAVTLAPAQLATHGLLVGASGAGKSTTLLAILRQQIALGQGVVTIDLKGSPDFTASLRAAAEAAGRPFRVWTADGNELWNPLAHGNPTELKDKLVATERFTEPHYQRAAERYVQTALRVLALTGGEASLAAVVALMEPRRLGTAAQALSGAEADQVQDYLGGLGRDQLSAVRGLGTRLALLSESTAGPFLAAAPGDGIDLARALDGGEVVLFSLNSLRYGHLAAQLGTLAIQDLVSVAGRRLSAGGARPPATVAIDEFSALGSDQLLALLARGREAGISVLVATQELSDLERAGRGFRDQLLGLTSVKLIHRQEVFGSARMVAELAGTEWGWQRTRQLRSPLAGAGTSRGTLREVEQFVVHPNEVMGLPTGRAVLLSKVPRAQVRRVAIAAPGRSATARAGRDQPEPGVTR